MSNNGILAKRFYDHATIMVGSQLPHEGNDVTGNIGVRNNQDGE